MTEPAYARHEALVAAARARPEVWRIIAGLGVVALAGYLLNATLAVLLSSFAPEFWKLEFSGAKHQGATPASLLILLGSFGFVTIGTFVAAQVLQGRSFLSLIGPLRPAMIQFGRTFRALVILTVAILLLPPWGGDDVVLQPNIDPGLWAALLPLSLFGLLVQTSAEEILFRGYIQSQLAARFGNPVVWMVVPSLLFAAGHYLPDAAGNNAPAIAIWSFVFGVLMADLTARAGTLGPAIAVHFVNNLTSLLLISLPGDLSGLSLFTVPYDMADEDMMRQTLPIEFATLLVAWLAARVAIRR